MQQKRPQNCGTSFCSCIECVCEEPKKPMRVLGYVREEVLDLCRHSDNAASLTVVPVAPKSGRWVPLYVEGEK